MPHGRDVALLTGIALNRRTTREVRLNEILGGAGILSVRGIDPSRALPSPDRTRWLLTIQGRFR